MNKANNARSAASRSRVKEAYVALLQEQRPDDITVSEVCRRAGVNRTTFYAHFFGLSDLLEAIEADAYSIAAKQLLPALPDAASLVSRETLCRMLAYLRQNASFYRVSLAARSESKLVKGIAERVKTTYIVPYLKRGGVYSPGEMDLQFEFVKAGSLAVIRAWLESGCAATDQEVAGLLEKVTRRCLG